MPHADTGRGPLPADIGTVVVGGGILGLCVAGFLAEEGLKIRWMARRRLREAVAYFDPQVGRPEDSLAGLPE